MVPVPKGRETWEPIADGNIPAPMLERFFKPKTARNVNSVTQAAPYFDAEGNSETIG